MLKASQDSARTQFIYKIAGVLPLRARWGMRRAARYIAAALARLGFSVPRSWLMNSKNPFDGLSRRGEREIWRALRRQSWNLLEMREVRRILARDRLASHLSAQSIRRLSSEPANAGRNTLDYNLKTLLTSADVDRPMTLVRPILSIGRVARSARNMKVLSIGPRSEIEIFALLAHGFVLANISALDLFSYSPYVEIGDMHALPYADDSFDVVLLGWVLSYSKRPAAAAGEIYRCCRDRAVVAISADYSDATMESVLGDEANHIQSCDQILALFDRKIGQIYFRHEPVGRADPLVMVIFEVRKPDAYDVGDQTLSRGSFTS